MQVPFAYIVSCGANTADRRVVVELSSAVACPRCAAGKGCGAGLLGNRGRDLQIPAQLAAGIEVRSGDRVSLVLRPANVLRAALLVYGYPLAGAVAAAALSYLFGFGDVAAAVAALGGLAAGALLAHGRLRNAKCLREFTPTVVGLAPEAVD